MNDLAAAAAAHDAMFNPDNCPDWVIESLARYLKHRIQPGGCLHAILANDLQQAFGRADVDTARSMPSIVSFVYNRLPANSHGSYEIVNAWLLGDRP